MDLFPFCSENVQLVFPQVPAVPPQDSIPTPNSVATLEAFKCLKLLYMTKMQLKWDQVRQKVGGVRGSVERDTTEISQPDTLTI